MKRSQANATRRSEKRAGTNSWAGAVGSSMTLAARLLGGHRVVGGAAREFLTHFHRVVAEDLSHDLADLNEGRAVLRHLDDTFQAGKRLAESRERFPDAAQNGHALARQVRDLADRRRSH